MKLQSHCKVNLILNILGKRQDGFHELETVMHPIGLHDTLAFERRSGVTRRVELTCSDPALPTDSGNLVYRAAERFLDAVRVAKGVAIHLEKRIPLAAGLGGGSANAAVTLLGLNRMFDSRLSDAELHTIASELGSDVPFFLQQQPALAVGRGEKVTSLPRFESLAGVYGVLIHPGFGISTAWAYQKLASFPAALNGQPGRAQRLVSCLNHSLESAAGEFYNSLEAPALVKYPILALYQDFLRENGAVVALMSGSGSTTFALVRGQSAAEMLDQRFKVKFGTSAWTAVVPLESGFASPI